MSYTKTIWQDGDIITTEKLNKMEDGIEQAGSGGSSARIIDLTTLEHREEVVDGGTVHSFSGYEAGLSAIDFVNAWLKLVVGKLMPALWINRNPFSETEEFTLGFDESVQPTSQLTYRPETGEFYFFIESGSGGGHSAK